MKKLKAINMLNLTLVYWLAMDKWNAPGWVWVVVGILLVGVWVSFLIDLFHQEDTGVIMLGERDES